MCYSNDDRPPLPPGATGSAEGEELVLNAADGNRFMAYATRPGNSNGAQVLIYPDVRGLHSFYKDLALRFAEVGVGALALDYFGRTAGMATRDDSFEYMPHVQQIRLDTFLADAKAARDYLREAGGGDCKVFTVGFCMGGSLALISGAQDLDLTGSIVFYGGLTRNFGGEGTALDFAAQSKYPVLGLYGGEDQGIPPEQREALKQRLDQSGVEHNIHVYEGAPHSFFDRKATEFADASADAWRRMLDFIAAHTRV
jgi:carboxymethylenebutenolidase